MKKGVKFDDASEKRRRHEASPQQSLHADSQMLRQDGRPATQLVLADNAGQRSQQDIFNEVMARSRQISASMDRLPADEINLKFNSKQQGLMQDSVNNLFDLLKQPDTERVDLCELKAYFAHQNVQNHNPTLFKRINDLALSSEFAGVVTRTEFQALFLNS